MVSSRSSRSHSMLRRPFRSSLVVQSSSSRPTPACSCRSSHQRWYSPRAVFTAFCTSLPGRGTHSGHGWGQAVLPAGHCAPRRVRAQDTLRTHPTRPRIDPGPRTPTAVPNCPARSAGHAGTSRRGDQAPSSLPHCCHSPSDNKKWVFERHVTHTPPEAKPPSPRLWWRVPSQQRGKRPATPAPVT